MMTAIHQGFYEQVERLGQRLQCHRLMIGTAESCTAGLLSSIITMVPGSSAWFERGFVTYSNAAKVEQLGVSAQAIEKHGAVSEEVAIQMAEGVLGQVAAIDVGVSITGVAGPGGGTKTKPVGMVCFAVAKRTADGVVTLPFTQRFEGDRDEVRLQSCYYIVDQLNALLQPLD